MIRHALVPLFVLACSLAAAPVADTSDPARTATSLDKARIRLVTAIDTALREMEGAQFLEAELVSAADGPVYQIHLRSAAGLRRVSVSATTGEVAKVEDAVPAPEQAAEWEALAKAAAAVHVSPLQALESVEGVYRGLRVLNFELELRGGAPVYRADMLSGDRIFEAVIDAGTGAVREDPKGEPAKPASPADARVWNFDKDEPGKPPAGWTFAETGAAKPEGVWQVASDAAAVSKPHVLTLTRGTEANSDYNVAMIDKTSFEDVDLAVKVRANTGKVDQGGGVMWRCKDANNYYICRFNPLESNFRVYKVVDGKRTQLESAKVEATAGRWYTVRAVMIGGRITCRLDDQKLLESEDDAMKDAGMIGLWTKADAVTSFDDLAAKEPAATGEKPKAAEKVEPKPGM